MPPRHFVTLGLFFPLVVGLVLRVLAASTIHAPWGDNGAAILDVAKNVATGRGYTTNRIWTFYGPPRQFGQPEGNRQPLLPLAETAVRIAAGPSFRAAQSVPLACGLGAIVLCFMLGLHVGGPRVASMGAWFAATDPVQVYFSAQVEDQIVFLLFFLVLALWLTSRKGEQMSNAFVPGLLLAALYLTRANGLLVVAAYCAVCLLHRRIRHGTIVLAVFTLLCLPWFIRNVAAFGNPFHTDNAFFLFTDRFSDVFSVRASPPSFGEYVATHSILEMGARWFKGAYLSLEGFLLGNIFRDEPFARGSLAIPLLLAAYGCWRSRFRALLHFGGVAFLLHFFTVSWHAHGTYRYYIPFYALVLVGASCGLERLWTRWCSQLAHTRRVGAVTAALLLLAFPLIRPLAHTLGKSDREVHEEAMEVVTWLSTKAGPNAVIMDFPIIEKYVYRYDLPTVNTPIAGLTDIWKVARDYGATYLVVCADQLALVPSFTAHWRNEHGTVVERTLPAFLTPEFTTQSGMFRVYSFGGEQGLSVSASIEESG
jgi:hypothetical protein